jgi:chemotaxis methyl-accepting protein methylase
MVGGGIDRRGAVFDRHDNGGDLRQDGRAGANTGVGCHTQVLETARAGIYSLERLQKIPIAQKRQFFHKGSGERAGYAKVKTPLQELVTFRQLNLLDDQWPLDSKFDAIFCRNVMIYFDKQTQRRLIEKFMRVLQPDGLFFAGHSESFFHASDLMVSIGNTVYRPAALPLSKPVQQPQRGWTIDGAQ